MTIPTRFITTRKTQSGDYLIFEAVPYKLGIGVEKVGSTGAGYTTGHQFGRADTEPEAVAAAEAIVAEKSDGFCHWVLIKWRPPTEKNVQFVDMPKKFPECKTYDKKVHAEASGWIYVNPAKTLEWHRGRVIKCVDVSPDNSFGYDFAIRIVGEEINFAETGEIGIGRFVSIRFRSGDVVEGILAARGWIDEDLVTIKEAASLTGKSIQSLSQHVVRGSVTGYANPAATGKRQGRVLVSKAQLGRLGYIEGQDNDFIS